ncbi:MAG: DUF1697 domain-containing protein [Chloroflexi bacterium]|nr:DUF1697 domain-containing protein [Chloroflexota bacterium]
MPVFISLLRGINVGGNKKINMAELRTLYESLGLREAQTLLQTGNVIFETDITDREQLIAHIEKGIEDAYGFHSDIIIRTVDELIAAVEAHLFSEEQLADPKKIVVMFLSDEPEADAIHKLKTGYSGPEEMFFSGKEAYLYYPDGMGRSQLSYALIERRLKTSGTVRNWNTTNKLRTLAEEFKA